MDNLELYYLTHSKGIGKELTGSPPISFESNGAYLMDWRVYGSAGGVGDKTKNLCKEKYVTGNVQNSAPLYRLKIETPIPISNGKTYTLSYDSDVFELYIDTSPTPEYPFSGNLGYCGNISAWLTSPYSFTSTNDGYLAITVRRKDNSVLSVSDVNFGVMFEEGAAATVYEPCGYRIFIICGGMGTDIYVDEPLKEGESISMSDTGVSVPTVNGENTLEVAAAVQPSQVYIKYGSGNVNRSLMKYLEYKYKFERE